MKPLGLFKLHFSKGFRVKPHFLALHFKSFKESSWSGINYNEDILEVVIAKY
jgi:hypothetical protein